MIIKVEGGGSGVYGNIGSCENLVDYLQREDFKSIHEGRQIEYFFNQKEDKVELHEVIYQIDNNRKGLKAKEAKFYIIIVAPSIKETIQMGVTEQELSRSMRDYIRKEVMPRYADGFNKGIKTDDLVYFAKIHHQCNERCGEDFYAHIIVSHKTKNNGKAISPNTNHTGKKIQVLSKVGLTERNGIKAANRVLTPCFSTKGK